MLNVIITNIIIATTFNRLLPTTFPHRPSGRSRVCHVPDSAARESRQRRGNGRPRQSGRVVAHRGRPAQCRRSGSTRGAHAADSCVRRLVHQPYVRVRPILRVLSTRVAGGQGRSAHQLPAAVLRRDANGKWWMFMVANCVNNNNMANCV